MWERSHRRWAVPLKILDLLDLRSSNSELHENILKQIASPAGSALRELVRLLLQLCESFEKDRLVTSTTGLWSLSLIQPLAEKWLSARLILPFA